MDSARVGAISAVGVGGGGAGCTCNYRIHAATAGFVLAVRPLVANTALQDSASEETAGRPAVSLYEYIP